MATWTPKDLRNYEFVQQKLSPLDRSNALLTLTQGTDLVTSKLEENKKSLAEIQSQTNNQYSYGTVRDARRAAQDAIAAGTSDAAALQAKYEDLKANRDELNAQADKLINNIQDGEDALRTYAIAISNLEAAGAVPPGTNQFTPPPGYTQATDTLTPPAQVPASQNPNPTPATGENETLQNSFPVTTDSYGGGTQAEANAINNAIKEQEQVQAETELGATQAEADAIIKAQREADANEYAFGATQAEADAINQQKQVSDFESSLGAAGATQAEADAINNALANAGAASRALTGPLLDTQSQATQQDVSNFQQKQDWRVRLRLAPGSTYLYNNTGNEGILLPLAETDGVIFPYTPAISVAYSAAYDNTELTHTNYKFFSYRASAVDSISITCDFTAQDTFEANYLLAVIHFFRSATKMFYGQDQNPKPGTPPPLCYLTGLGSFQFDEHPLAITGFTYSLPTDVDYIRAGATTTPAGVNKRPGIPNQGASSPVASRLQSSGLRPGAIQPPVYFTENAGTREPTYVPTKIQMAITAIPIVTRNDISNTFSLEEYATGKLLRGSKRQGGGIW
jgi:hypothetical protein